MTHFVSINLRTSTTNVRDVLVIHDRWQEDRTTLVAPEDDCDSITPQSHALVAMLGWFVGIETMQGIARVFSDHGAGSRPIRLPAPRRDSHTGLSNSTTQRPRSP